MTIYCDNDDVCLFVYQEFSEVAVQVLSDHDISTVTGATSGTTSGTVTGDVQAAALIPATQQTSATDTEGAAAIEGTEGTALQGTSSEVINAVQAMLEQTTSDLEAAAAAAVSAAAAAAAAAASTSTVSASTAAQASASSSYVTAASDTTLVSMVDNVSSSSSLKLSSSATKRVYRSTGSSTNIRRPRTVRIAINESIISLLIKLHSKLSAGKVDSYVPESLRPPSTQETTNSRVGDGAFFVGKLLDKIGQGSDACRMKMCEIYRKNSSPKESDEENGGLPKKKRVTDLEERSVSFLYTTTHLLLFDTE